MGGRETGTGKGRDAGGARQNPAAPQAQRRARDRGRVVEAPPPRLRCACQTRPARAPARSPPAPGERAAGEEEAHRCRGPRARWAAPCGSSRTSRRPGGAGRRRPFASSRGSGSSARAAQGAGGRRARPPLPCAAADRPPRTADRARAAGPWHRADPAPARPARARPLRSERGRCRRPHSAHWLPRSRPRPLSARPRPRAASTSKCSAGPGHAPPAAPPKPALVPPRVRPPRLSPQQASLAPRLAPPRAPSRPFCVQGLGFGPLLGRGLQSLPDSTCAPRSHLLVRRRTF